MSNNTIVEGEVPNETWCSGGGISLEATPRSLEVSRNIIAMNSDCGIACRSSVDNIIGPNLFWMNQGIDLGYGPGACPSTWAAGQIFADPQFCNPEAGNYAVSVDSPALTGAEKMGVWTTPGCGPGVPVRPITWGRIKAKY